MTVVLSFWGKGGTGKTTVSAAVALGLKELGYSVLALSTDPVPTLREAIGFNEGSGLGARVMLPDIIELSEKDVIGLWKETFGDQVYRVLSSFLPVERDVIDYIAGAPGIADQFTFYFIYKLWKTGEYDVIVWDTAAAGGSLRLLRLEHEIYNHLSDSAKLYLKVKGALERLRRGKEDPLSLISEWRKLAEDILNFLSSSEHKAFIVSTPDALGISVTDRLLDEFNLHNINVERIIVNMVYDKAVSEVFKNTFTKQKMSMEEIERRYGRNPGVCIIPFKDEELRGKFLRNLYPYISACINMKTL